MLSQDEEPTVRIRRTITIPAHLRDYDVSGFSRQSSGQLQQKASSVEKEEGPLPEATQETEKIREQILDLEAQVSHGPAAWNVLHRRPPAAQEENGHSAPNGEEPAASLELPPLRLEARRGSGGHRRHSPERHHSPEYRRRQEDGATTPRAPLLTGISPRVRRVPSPLPRVPQLTRVPPLATTTPTRGSPRVRRTPSPLP